MSRTQAARAASARGRANKRRSTKSKRGGDSAGARPSAPAWSDLEQAFFAAAPPDEPARAVEPDCFADCLDDTPAPPSRRWEWAGAARPVVVAAGTALRRVVFGLARRSRPVSTM